MSKIGPLRLSVQIIFFIMTIFAFKLGSPLTNKLIIVGLLLLVGTYYCGWICAFGTMQDLVYTRLGKHIKYKLAVPYKYNRYLLWFRYITLFVTIAFISKTLYARGTFLDMLAGKDIAPLLAWIMTGFLLLSLIMPRPFCRYFCVEGARYAAIGLARAMTVTRDNASCIHCQRCDRACPMGIKVSAADSMYVPHCISCGSCIDACPKKGTLSLKLRSFANWRNLLLLLLGLGYTYMYLQKTLVRFGGL